MTRSGWTWHGDERLGSGQLEGSAPSFGALSRNRFCCYWYPSVYATGRGRAPFRQTDGHRPRPRRRRAGGIPPGHAYVAFGAIQALQATRTHSPWCTASVAWHSAIASSRNTITSHLVLPHLTTTAEHKSFAGLWGQGALSFNHGARLCSSSRTLRAVPIEAPDRHRWHGRNLRGTEAGRAWLRPPCCHQAHPARVADGPAFPGNVLRGSSHSGWAR